MKRTLTLLSAVLLALGMMAGPAAAQVDVDEPHPHSLLIGFGDDDGPPTYDRCVDLAGGRDQPLRSHHDNVHTGGGVDDESGQGVNVKGIRTAGHAVIPYSCDNLPFEE